MRRLLRAARYLGAGAGGYLLLVRGALTLDLGIGRRVRPLRPIRIEVAAPPETVFDVVAGPYVNKTPAEGEGTVLVYQGELGTDGWALGAWWDDRVAAPWERAVDSSLAQTKAEAERRHRPAGPR